MDFPVEMTHTGSKEVYSASDNLAYVDALANGWTVKASKPVKAPASKPKPSIKSLKKSLDLEEILTTM
mgnify:CR=1 FL=1